MAGRQWAAVSSSIVIGASGGTAGSSGTTSFWRRVGRRSTSHAGQRGDLCGERSGCDDHRAGADVAPRVVRTPRDALAVRA